MLHSNADTKKAPYFIETIVAVRNGPIDYLNIKPLSITYNNPGGDDTNKVGELSIFDS